MDKRTVYFFNEVNTQNTFRIAFNHKIDTENKRWKQERERERELFA